MAGNTEKISVDYKNLREHEPNLGPAWAVLMLILYLLKRMFPAEPYTWLWYLQIYVLTLVFFITIYVLVRRHVFFRDHDAKAGGDRRHEGADAKSRES